MLTAVCATALAQTAEMPIAVRADEIRRSQGCEAAIDIYRDAIKALPNGSQPCGTCE